jgi:hypothetical protein
MTFFEKYTKAREAFKELNSQEKESLFFDLLLTKDIDFVKITKLYVLSLEREKELQNKKESLFSSCLATAIRKPFKSDIPWHHSQAFVLMEKWLPDDFLNNVLNKKTEELIKKNRELLR